MSSRTTRSSGFTLIELLLVLSVIAVLVAILLPNVLAARTRSFDAATQTCLKALAAQQEVAASDAPFEYDSGLDPIGLTECGRIELLDEGVTASSYSYEARHQSGRSTYAVSSGRGVELISTP